MDIVVRRTGCARGRRVVSLDEIKRIGQLEAASGGTGVDVAVLFAYGRDDGVAGRLNLGALAALERHDRMVGVVVGTGDQLGPALESGMVQIQQRRVALAVAAASDEEYRNVAGPDGVEKGPRRLYRARVGRQNPRIEAATQGGLFPAR